jgi:hypothetical protein
MPGEEFRFVARQVESGTVGGLLDLNRRVYSERLSDTAQKVDDRLRAV